MKTQNTLENGGSNQAAITQIQTIKLGLDVHADSIVAVRILDGQSRQHAQRFKPDAFLEWIQKMPGQAERVYTCYEAGPLRVLPPSQTHRDGHHQSCGAPPR